MRHNAAGKLRLSAHLPSSPATIAAWKYIYVSPELERATGISPDQFVGKSLREMPLQDYDWQSLEASCHEAIAEKKTIARELHDGTAQNLIPASYLVLRNDT
jgi:signal transduction histidine kinase